MKTGMRTRLVGIGGLVALVIGIGAGCGEVPDNNFAQTTADPLTARVFTLHNYQTNYCLGVRAGTPTVGTTLVVWDCDGSANQNWQQTTLANGLYRVKNFVANDRCLDATRQPYGTYPKGDSVDINLCDSPTASVWDVTPAGPDLSGHPCYQFSNSYDGTVPMVMGVSAGSTARGASVIIWDDFYNANTHPDQYWCVY